MARSAFRSKFLPPSRWAEPQPSAVVPNFTTATDDQVVGDAGANTFTARTGLLTGQPATLHAGETLDGGAGIDTFRLTFNAAAANSVPLFKASNIEVAILSNLSGNQQTVDALQFDEQLQWVISQHSTASLKVTNLRANQAIQVQSGLPQAGATMEFVYGAGATRAFVTVDTGFGSDDETVRVGGVDVAEAVAVLSRTALSGDMGALYLTGNRLTSADLYVSGGDIELDRLAVDLANTVTVRLLPEGASGGDLRVGRMSNVRTFDATGFAGDVEMHADGGGASNNTLIYLGGAGSDVFHTRAALTSGSASGGSGDDTLVVHASNHINAANGKSYTGFETLRLLDGVAVNVAQLAGGIQYVQLSPGAGTTSLTGLGPVLGGGGGGVPGPRLTVDQSFSGTLHLALADATGTRDRIALAFEDADDAAMVAGKLSMGGVERLDLFATSDVNLTDLSDCAGLKEITTFGAGDVRIDLGNMVFDDYLFLTLDSTGAVDIDASRAVTEGIFAVGLAGEGEGAVAPSIRFKGQAGWDHLQSSAGQDEVIYTGGDDQYILGGGGDSFSFNGVTGMQTAAAGSPVLVISCDTGDSRIGGNANPQGVFNAATAFDPRVTDVITGISNAQALTQTNGTEFLLSIDGPFGVGAGLVFGQSVVFGSTAVPVGGVFVLDHNANTAFVFQDADRSGTVTVDDFMIKLVGNTGFHSSEFQAFFGNDSISLMFASQDAD